MTSILIIEDDNSFRNSMKLVLELEGFECSTVSDGRQGLVSMRENRPDIILCDILMSDMDGHAVLRETKNDPDLADIPFIFVTALGDRSDVRLGMSSGADDYLTKPFTDEELVAAVVGRLHRYAMIQMRHSYPTFQKELTILQKNITQREREILLLVGRGITSKEIADKLYISIKTVQAHRANLMKKLNAVNAAHLSRWAVIAELLPS
ncbi:response regulator transcription factor [uncultured Desulfuromusa sp.]|uniref:response regulator transcription factor n=1 Tax=uncultured Desulfuromusa sp. TaxID=219183 RepID=UPI002AA84055|nr:response regulator transcription factor [uncultured Desulfuromusa sp.]